MSAGENKALVRRAFEEGWNTGNLDLFDETTAQEYVLHDPSVSEEEVRGVEGVKRFASMYLRAFPDLRCTIEDQLAEGDKVATRWTSSATHQGELMGIPPTGNQTGVSGITISRVSEGKLVEDWNIWDTLGLMRQLGVVPEPGGGFMEHSHQAREGERRSPMATEENRALSNRVAEAIGKGDLNALDELMPPGLPRSSSGKWPKGRRWPTGSCSWARTWASSRSWPRPGGGSSSLATPSTGWPTAGSWRAGSRWTCSA